MTIAALTEVNTYVSVTLYLRSTITNARPSESHLCRAHCLTECTKHQLAMAVAEPLDMQLQAEFVRLCKLDPLFQ